MSKHLVELTRAFERLRGKVVRTPLLEASSLNDLLFERRGVRARVLVKAESLQHTGAFKFRGALHRLLRLDARTRSRGVVAFSSGNFAQALALASQITGTKCTIVSPHDAPPLKLERTRRYGADVLLSHPDPGENREVAAAAMAERFSRDHNAALLHPFDDYEVIYGQGSLALELFDQHQKASFAPKYPADGFEVDLHEDDPLAANDDEVEAEEAEEAGGRGEEEGVPPPITTLVVPCGGGGMLAGCTLAAELASPQTRVVAIEPEGYDDHVQSFRAEGKTRTPLSGAPTETICDALQASAPGKITWGRM